MSTVCINQTEKVEQGMGQGNGRGHGDVAMCLSSNA